MLTNNPQKKIIGAIIQARTGSSRLPNKVFADLAGKPLLWHVYNRLTFSKLIDKIIIATTVNKEDDLIYEWAKENGILISRGSQNDVLDRFYNAAKENNLDIIVRITADDPFKDPYLIDLALDIFLSNNLNFVYNNNPPTFPEGLDVEIFDFDSLILANDRSNSDFEREHVTQYFFNNLNDFKHLNITSNKNYSNYRWTIDTLDDLKMVKLIYQHLYTENDLFPYQDILNLIEMNPWISLMNINGERSEMYKNKGYEKI